MNVKKKNVISDILEASGVASASARKVGTVNREAQFSGIDVGQTWTGIFRPAGYEDITQGFPVTIRIVRKYPDGSFQWVGDEAEMRRVSGWDNVEELLGGMIEPGGYSTEFSDVRRL